MKKNVMMRAASALGVAVLLSTCVISGTFAKYTTSASGGDTARVAKWGVTVEATGNAFATSYDSNADVKTVISSEADVKVVAPGTKGELAKATINGQPEVKVEVSYSATLTLTGWTVSIDETSTEYCPLVFFVNGTAYGLSNVYYLNESGEATKVARESTTVAELETAVQNAIAAVEKAQYEIKATITSTLEVSWQWAFSPTVEGGTVANSDEKDTQLADKTGAEIPTVKLDVTTTVTQVD